MLDEDNNSEMLDSHQASIYRCCIGILLYVTSDFVECQYAIRGLSQSKSMSKPTKQSMECSRYLCTYLLGCTDQCFMLKHEPPTTLKIILLRYIAIVTGQSIELHDVQ